MASYNRIIMMGNLTRDPEFKQLASGMNVCRLGLASNRQFKNKQAGTMIQEVCFIDVDVWGAQAESCRQFLSKGRAVLVEGRLKMDSWVDNEGGKKTKHTIVADRVTFLSAAAHEDASASDSSSSDFADNSNAGTSEFIPASTGPAQSAMTDKPKATRTPVKRAPTGMGSTTSGEVNLKDEAPFEDDLPF